MASFPNYNFSDPNLNYATVEISLLQMYADVNAQVGLSDKAKQIPYDIINLQMQLRLQDKAEDTNRWKKDLETAYKLLYPFS